MYRLLNTVGKSTLSVKSLPRSPVFNPITAINSNFKSLQPMSIRLQSTTKTVGNPNKKSLRSYSTQNEQENGWKSSPTSFARYWVTRENGLSAERYSAKWWWEALVLCVVFAITGSSTMYFVRPFMREALNLEGSLKDGPWSYRIAYFTVMMPIYSVILVTVGTIFGRHQYFKKFAIKMWSRMIPERVKKSMGF